MLTVETGNNGDDYLLLENGNKIPVVTDAMAEKYAYSIIKDDQSPLITVPLIATNLSISLEDLTKFDPERANLIWQQLQKNNVFSKIDKNVSLDSVRVSVLSIPESDPQMQSYRDQKQICHLLGLTLSDYERIGQDTEILAVIRHEIGHGNYSQTHSNFFKRMTQHTVSMSEKQLDELHADRYAGLEMGEYLLSTIAKDSQTRDMGEKGASNGIVFYDYGKDFKDDHPSIRTRIAALLRQSYGNDIFRNSGEFDEDHIFRPRRDASSVPVTEDGSKVANWDDVVAPAIEKQVASDLNRLDQLVHGGNFTEAAAKQFIQEVSRNAERFRKDYPPQVESAQAVDVSSSVVDGITPSNPIYQRLAESFRQYASEPEYAASLQALHPEMSNALLALKFASQEIQQSALSAEEKQSTVEMVQANIALGISLNRFPDVAKTNVVNMQVTDQELELNT